MFSFCIIIPTNFKYATTIGFWISFLCLFVEDNLYRKILIANVFAISTVGLIRQYEVKENNLTKNIIKYVIPLSITLKLKNKHYPFTYLLFSPTILYLSYTYDMKLYKNRYIFLVILFQTIYFM